MSHDFKTPITDFSAYKLAEYLLGEYTIADIDVQLTNCYVVWNAELELRERGIKSIDVSISLIYGCFEWSFAEDELTPEEYDLIMSKGGVIDGDRIVGDIEFTSQDWKIESNLQIE